MRVVIPGGTGEVGQILVAAFRARGDDVVVLSRSSSSSGSSGARFVSWDGRTLGAWASEIDGADVVINLAGRRVNARYNKNNLTDMFASRVDATTIVGAAIAAAKKPPRVWLNMSTATIYSHRFDAPNDDVTGVIGGSERDIPRYWRFAVEIARAWERAFADAPTPSTRKVTLRTTLVMSTGDGAFRVFARLAKVGLGGSLAGGKQWLSWIHERDFVRAVLFLVEREDLSGVFNMAAPEPLPQREFMRALRAAVRMPIGLPATAWMASIGVFFFHADTELLFKSRYVVSKRLADAGFTFEHPHWPVAVKELVARL